LQLIFNASSDGLWTWELQTGETTYSANWKRMVGLSVARRSCCSPCSDIFLQFGYEEHELPNSLDTWRKLIDRDDACTTLALLNECARKRELQFQTMERYRHKNGSVVYVLCRGIYDVDDEGRFVRVVGSVTDVTSLKKAKEDAVRASQAKSLFLANMSHEVRMRALPLTARSLTRCACADPHSHERNAGEHRAAVEQWAQRRAARVRESHADFWQDAARGHQ
jgi:PAS domain S-box-containing protein